MIESRKLEDLTPETEKKCRAFIEKCREAGIDLLITSTYRDKEKQDALYAQGRNGHPGKIVTNARGGQSFHNYKVAFDFVPIVHGKAQYADIATFKRCGAIAKSVGLEWAGDWKTFKEYAHCQFTNGLTLRDLQAGKKPI
jgi:peptidoglycan L-alanyl-D-glutamate endopeptidase CwlK